MQDTVCKIRNKIRIGAVLFTGIFLFALLYVPARIYAFPEELCGVGIHSLIGKDADKVWSVHYPAFANSGVDGQLSNTAAEILEHFKAKVEAGRIAPGECAELNVDYEIGRYNERTVSVAFHIYEALPGEDAQNSMQTFTYDLNSGRQYTLADLAASGNVQKLYDACIPSRGTEAEEAYASTAGNTKTSELFLLRKDSLELWTRENGVFRRNSAALTELQGVLNVEKLGRSSGVNAGYIPGSLPQREYNAIGPEPGMPKVALTFDDGPNGENTQRLLEELKKRNIKATFFLLGNKAEHYPELIAEMSAEGHEIGNHGYNHRDMKSMTSAEVTEQLKKTDLIIETAIGSKASCIRPPYGNLCETLERFAADTRRPILLWSVDTLDWKQTDEKNIVRSTVEQVRDGDVILLHDAYSNSVDAAIEIVDELIGRGFVFMTASELISYSSDGIRPGEVYTHLQGKE